MRLTIIRDMGLIHVDGRGHDEQDMTGVPENVHAVQWYGESGEIEFVDNTPNEEITSLPAWASDKADAIIAKLAEEDAEADAAKAYAESPEGKAEMIRSERDFLISETDWWALSDVSMTDAQAEYRQALRDITSQADFPENIVWPIKP
jgi:uncharacterized protein YqfA (UPF0365 family)